MTTTKKLLAMVLTVLLLLGTLTGCGSGGQPEPTEAPAAPEAAEVPEAPEESAEDPLQAHIQVPLYDDGEVKVQLTGMEIADDVALLFHVEMVNDSDVDVSGLIYDAQVNGADVDAYWDLDTMEAGQSGSFDMYVLEPSLTDGANDFSATVQMYIINESMDLLCDAPVEWTADFVVDDGLPTAAIGAALKGEPAGREAEPVEVREPEPAGDDEFEAHSLDEPLYTTDPVTLSSGSRSVSLSLPTEYAVLDSFSQLSSDYVIMMSTKTTGGCTTIIGFENLTNPEEYVEYYMMDASMAFGPDFGYTDTQMSEVMHDTFNGFDVAWAKLSALEEKDGDTLQQINYYAAANIGTYVFTVNMDYSQSVGQEAYVDDNVIEAIFDHVTDLGAAAPVSAEPAQLWTVEGNTFTSDSFGVSYSIGDGWRFYSEEELQAIGESGDTAVYAVSESTIQGISMFVSPLPGVYNSGGQIAEAMMAQYNMDPEGYMQQMNLEGGTMTMETVTIGGQEQPTQFIEIPADNGHVVYERAIYRVAPSGNGVTTNVMMITLSCADNKDQLTDVLNMITFQPEG